MNIEISQYPNFETSWGDVGRIDISIDKEKVMELLSIWDFSSCQIEKMNIRIYFYSTIQMFTSAAAYYSGFYRGHHHIFINQVLVLDGLQISDGIATCTPKLNEVLIHELRHVYWNVIAPCQCMICRYVMSYFIKVRHRERREEEIDCQNFHSRYGNFPIIKVDQ